MTSTYFPGAVLVGPNNDETILLDQGEYETLKRALALARSGDTEANAIADALPDLEQRVKDYGVLRTFLAHLMSALGEHADEIQAMLVKLGEQPIFMREKRGSQQCASLEGFLKVLQDQGWLADFLDVRIQYYAEHRPTPLEVMNALAESAVIFEGDVQDAKKMIRDWPAFFPTQMEAKAESAAG
jgi:hypothetical protein